VLTLFDRTVGRVHWTVVTSERREGDLHPIHVDPEVLAARQRSLTGRRWVMSEQVHGVDVVEVDDGSSWPLAGVADVVVAPLPGLDVALWTADCAPVFLLDRVGRAVAFHAGWRGIAAGIVDRAVDEVTDPEGVIAVVGPTIGSCCYEFGRDDAARVARGAGVPLVEVVGCSPGGTDRAVRLDVPETLRLALARHGIAWSGAPACTACSGDWYSHRSRGDSGRHATIARARPVTDPRS
jgi:YfiH family protein